MITKHSVKKTQTQKSQEVSLFQAGGHKTHCQENATHKRANGSAHFMQVVTRLQGTDISARRTLYINNNKGSLYGAPLWNVQQKILKGFTMLNGTSVTFSYDVDLDT